MAKSISMNLQDVFLNQLRRDRVGVVVFLVNGFQLRGFIKGFDNFVIVLEIEGKQQVVYKHAISTISPVQPINMIFKEEKKEEEDQ
ncbi:MAG: RNA chaperone Hfq [Clostridia bacterium]